MRKFAIKSLWQSAGRSSEVRAGHPPPFRAATMTLSPLTSRGHSAQTRYSLTRASLSAPS